MTEAPYILQIRDTDLWLTIRGENYDEFYGNLVIAVGKEPADGYLARFAAERNLAAAGLNPQPMAAPPAPAGPPVPPTLPPAPAGQAEYNPYAPPAPPAAPPAPPAQQGGDWKANAPMCAHGKRRGYEGSNARGTYRAYFCAAPKDTPKEQKCSPIDAVTGKAWG